jgi:hypothetical protein
MQGHALNPMLCNIHRNSVNDIGNKITTETPFQSTLTYQNAKHSMLTVAQ